MRRCVTIFGLVAIAMASFLANPAPSRAQQYVYEYGSYPWTTPMSVPGGYVDAGNGNLHIEIPIASIPERGHVPFIAKLIYDSHIWQQVTSGGSTTWQPTNVLNTSWSGWRLVTSATTGTNFNVKIQSGTCTVIMGKIQGHAPYTRYENFSWTAPDGHIIPFNGISTFYDDNDGCGPNTPTANGLASDASGYHLYVTNYTYATVYAPDGTQVFPFVEDTNGNYYSAPNSNGDVTDTLGRSPITTTVNGNQTTYAVLNSQGATSPVVVTTESLPVNTLFGQPNVTECSTNCTVVVIESVALPDGTSYQFSYDEGATGTHYGELTGMTLSTGGAVTFAYENFKDAYSNQNEWVTSSQWGGSTGGTWSFTPVVLSSCPSGCTQQMTEVAPTGEKMVYGFTLNDGAWNTTAASYDTTANGSGLLQTVATAYNFSSPPYIVPTTVTTTLPVPGGNINKQTSLTFDTSDFGNVTAQTETSFATGTGKAYRTTDYTYLSNSDNNMVNKKQSIAVCSGAGPCTAPQIQINYDGTTTSSMAGVIQHDDTNFGTAYNARGNPTSVVHTDSPLNETTSRTYDMTGQVTSSTDMNGNVTNFSYADKYFNDSSNGPTATTPAGKTNAYLTQVTLPAPFAWTISSGYYLGTGQLAQKTDQNGVVSTFDYLDPANRPTSSKVPINATNYSWKVTSYAPSSEIQADSYTGIADASPSLSCNSCRHDQTNLDTFGRPLTQVLVNDPEGADTVTATYANGRLASATNAERTTSSPTDGSDSYSYDGLGRVTKVTHSDGTSASTYYGAAVTAGGGIANQLCSSSTYGLGYPVLVADEAGKKRQSWSDAFGRTIELDEPNNTGSLTQNTCYTYDMFNNITGVTQDSQTRTYLFDSLSRLVSSTTPETGVISANYFTLSEKFCSGNPALICERYNQTSQVWTYYTYDQLNRLTSVSYSDNKTPTATYIYDASTNQKGFLTGMTDESGTTTWTYNNVGWPITEQRTIAGITKTISYTYNGDGSVASITYPSGRIITYNTSNAQHTLWAKDLVNNIQYAVTASYSPVGTLNSVVYGPATGFNGVTTASSYNSRLEPTTVSAVSSAGTAQNLSLSYNLPSGNDGMLASVQNNVTSGLSESFTYDSLNRILSAATTAISGAGCWGQSYGTSGTPPPGPPDDQWSNLTEINVTNCTSAALGIAVNSATNRVSSSGFTYDYAGNMSGEPSPIAYTYTYDAENRLTQAAGTASGTWTYVYDGNSLRVEKSNASGGTLYWRSITSQTIAESDLSGNITSEYVFFAGQRIARRDASNNVYYYYTDQVGSTVTITTANGTPCYEATFTPYGQEMATQTSCESNYKFTGYERDSETGLDYAFARYYNSRLGRFMSADPIGGDLGDPQSLNRYAYVRNSPTAFADPAGLNKCRYSTGMIITSGNTCVGWGYYDSGFWDFEFYFAGGYSSRESGVYSLADFLFDYFEFIPGGGPPNFGHLVGQAIVALTNPNCAAIFGGVSNAIAALASSTLNMYSQGEANPYPNQISAQNWSNLTGQLTPTKYGFSAWNSASPGGHIFFTLQFNSLDPGFPSDSSGLGQMTGFFHEFEHVSNQNPVLDAALDASADTYNADYLKINTNCAPMQIETQSAPIATSLMPQ